MSVDISRVTILVTHIVGRTPRTTHEPPRVPLSTNKVRTATQA